MMYSRRVSMYFSDACFFFSSHYKGLLLKKTSESGDFFDNPDTELLCLLLI
jgi:hypothetical protein